MVEIMPNVESTQARILVIGVGGAGNNAVNRMVDENIQGVELVGIKAGPVFMQVLYEDPDRRKADQRSRCRCKTRDRRGRGGRKSR